MEPENREIELPRSMIAFYKAHQAMLADLNHPTLKFTLDGRLLGDIGEYLAEKHFGLTQSKKRRKGVDGDAPNGLTLQVKATQNELSGPSFSPGEGSAEHLLFLWLDFQGGLAKVIYNGPEGPVRALVKKDAKSTVTLKLANVQRLDEAVLKDERLPRIDDRKSSDC